MLVFVCSSTAALVQVSISVQTATFARWHASSPRPASDRDKITAPSPKQLQ